MARSGASSGFASPYLALSMRSPRRRFPDHLRLDIAPAVLTVVRHVRPKFSCRICEAITQAPAPDKPVARGKASFRFIAHLIMSKWNHQLPLYR